MSDEPINMLLWCPSCHEQHIDEPDSRTADWVNPPHRSHLCHACGTIWRPADVATRDADGAAIERMHRSLRGVQNITEATHAGQERAYTALSRIAAMVREVGR